MNAGEIIIKTKLDTKSFEAQIEETEHKLQNLIKEYERYSKHAEKPYAQKAMKVTAIEIEKTKNKLVDLKKRQDLLDNPPKDTIDWSEGFGKSLEKSIKKIGRLILGIFSIRSAYMLVRNAMNTILANDEQLNADITYMKNVIAYMLEPVVRRIVDWFKQLMFYVGYIAKAWFGIDIYASASEKALKSGVKNAKEMKKQMAGFDEMNVISDSSEAGGGGATTPSFNLGEERPIPGWLQWLGEHGEEIIAIISGIAGALATLKIEEILEKMGIIDKIDPSTIIGVGVAIAGIVYAVQGLLDYLKDPTWENFGQIIQGIGIFVAGLGIAFLGLPGIIAGAIILIVGTIIRYWDEIKGFFTNGLNWLTDKIDWVKENFGEQWADIYETVITSFKGIIAGFDTLFGGLKKILDGIIQFIKAVFSKDWEQAWEGIKKIFIGIFEVLKGVVITVFSFISGLVVSIAKTVGYTIADAFKFVVNGILNAIEDILNFPIKAVNKLINVINKVPGINISTLPTFNLPRLAKGGIINLPGKGVPVGSALAGERGAEGVIPLTDSQQMALLGEAIGKYININATVPVYVGNRQIAREIRKIEAENDFAYNG